MGKQLFVFMLGFYVFNVQGQDPNVLIDLDAPAYGITIKTNWPGTTGGWARGFNIGNEDASEIFVQFAAMGSKQNGVSTLNYAFIGPWHNKPFMTFLPDGKIGIGTLTPGELLSVNGNIRAREIKVEAANWPDYVFKEDYRLPTLKELERYIQHNKYLPGIPTASEVEMQGLSLGDISTKLLRKIEELTLYLIEKEAQVQRLEERVAELEKDSKK